MDPSPILLVHESPESFRTTLAPLGRFVYERSGRRSVVIGPVGDRPDMALISAGGTTLATVDERPAPPSAAAGRSSILSISRPSAVLAELRYWKREAARVLDLYQPAAIFTVKRDLQDSPFINRMARDRGIPVVGIQWSFLPPDDYERRRYRATYMWSVRDLPWPVRELRFLRARSEKWLHRLFYRVHGINWRDSYIRMADASVQAVTNSLYAEVFSPASIPPDRVRVTGHPEDDVLLACKVRYLDPHERTRARREFGLTDGARVFILAREFMPATSGLIDPEDDKKNLKSALDLLSILPGTQTVLKLHPKDDPAEYNWVRQLFPGVMIVHRCDLYKLIAVSDCLLTQGSSVTRWAVVLGVPAALIDFAGLEFTAQAEKMFRVPRLQAVSELKKFLDEVAAGRFRYDPEYIRPVVELVDGRATERIVALSGIAQPSRT